MELKRGEEFILETKDGWFNDLKYKIENNIIKVKIREIPENGKANSSIIDLFSKTFKIPKKNILIIKGLKSSNKTIQFLL